MRGALLVYIIFLSIVGTILTLNSNEKGMTILGTITVGFVLGIPMLKGASNAPKETQGK